MQSSKLGGELDPKDVSSFQQQPVLQYIALEDGGLKYVTVNNARMPSSLHEVCCAKKICAFCLSSISQHLLADDVRDEARCIAEEAERVKIIKRKHISKNKQPPVVPKPRHFCVVDVGVQNYTVHVACAEFMQSKECPKYHVPIKPIKMNVPQIVNANAKSDLSSCSKIYGKRERKRERESNSKEGTNIDANTSTNTSTSTSTSTKIENDNCSSNAINAVSTIATTVSESVESAVCMSRSVDALPTSDSKSPSFCLKLGGIHRYRHSNKIMDMDTNTDTDTDTNTMAISIDSSGNHEKEKQVKQENQENNRNKHHQLEQLEHISCQLCGKNGGILYRFRIHRNFSGQLQPLPLGLGPPFDDPVKRIGRPPRTEVDSSSNSNSSSSSSTGTNTNTGTSTGTDKGSCWIGHMPCIDWLGKSRILTTMHERQPQLNAEEAEEVAERENEENELVPAAADSDSHDDDDDDDDDDDGMELKELDNENMNMNTNTNTNSINNASANTNANVNANQRKESAEMEQGDAEDAANMNTLENTLENTEDNYYDNIWKNINSGVGKPTPNTEKREKRGVEVQVQVQVRQSRFAAFAQAVDQDVFPDYNCLVPVPMTVDMIRNR